MRILIIGEFSSFSKNLSAGFKALGHDCFVFSWGDGFKDIKEDVNSCMIHKTNVSPKVPFPFSNLLNRYYYFCSYLRLKKTVSQMGKNGCWDVILLININFVKNKYWQNFFTREMLLGLVKDPNKIYLSACGGDVPYYDYWSKQNWKNRPLIELNKGVFLSPKSIRHFYRCASFIHKVIPISYAYAEAWRESEFGKSFKVLPTIPLPIDTDKYIAHNEIEGKIVIFHGIIRPEAKGTRFIVEAMNRLQEKYPDKVECIAKGGMPISEYLPLLNKTNILIDQTYSSSTGMNALYALAMGKVLLGGNVPENAIENKYSNIPIINISADSNQIYAELEKLVLAPSKILRLSKEGRKYVEKIHDSKRVAQMYINLFNYENM